MNATLTTSKRLRLITLTLLLTLCGSLSAQNLVIEETRPSGMTVCMGNYPFTLKIKNNSSSPVSAMQLRVDLPDYIYYTGNLSNASELNTSNLNEPLFGLPQIGAHDSLIISYTAEASCGIIANMGNNLTVQNKYGYTYQFNGTTVNQPLTSFQSYNLLFANLSVSASNPITTALPNGQRINHLSAQYRTIEVTNGGNGAIDTVIIRITPEPEITYNGFVSASNTSISYPYTQVVNDIFIELTGNALQQAIVGGNNDQLFNTGESIRLIEDFTVVSCGSGNTLYKVQWGCKNDICNATISAGNATTNSNVNVYNGNAQFDIFTGSLTGQLSYCGNDGRMEFFFVNTGSSMADFARNLKIDILSYEEQSAYILPQAFELYGYEANGQSINASLISAHDVINWHFPKNSTYTPGYTIDFSANTIPGMLEDLDNDGFYDDLAAGDTLKITVKVSYPEFSELDTECPLNILHNYGLPQISWVTSCDELRTSIDGNNYYQNRYLAYNYPDQQTLADLITEPVDFVEGEAEKFTFCTGTWYHSWSVLDCPVNQYQGIINLPNGYHLNNTEVSWYSSAGDSILYTAAEIGNQVVINGGGTSNIPGRQNVWTGCFDVELVLICPASGQVESPSTISWELQYKCNDCEIFQRRVCASEAVYNHVVNCPGTVNHCHGIYSRDFEMKRSTLGWTDASRTEHVTETTAGIRLNAAYAYDEVQSRTSGFVIDTDFDAVFVDIIYTSTAQLFDFNNATFQVYRNGAFVNSCPAGDPVLLIIDGSYNHRFQMSCIGFLMPGDSIALVANWTISNSTVINKTREYEIPDFRSRFVSMQDDSVFACDSWGERFTLVSNNTFPLATMGTNPNTCGNLTINLNWINWGGSEGNDFPHEFRNLGKLDNVIRFALPQGYSYVAESAKMYAYTPNEDGVNPRFFTDSEMAIAPTFSANGDTLIFNETWPLVDKAGQGQISYTTPPVMNFQIMPTCERNDTVVALMDFHYTNNQYLENTALHQNISWADTWHDDGNIPATNMRWYHYLPNLKVNPGLATMDAFANTVSWDLQICNQRDAQHPVITAAEGVWIDIDNLVSNAGNVLISSVEQIGSSNDFNVSAYNAGSSSFVEIGAIDVNVCRTYRIHASFTNCEADELDSIQVLTGWNCGAYPQPELAGEASCHVDTSYFMIRYKTANLQMAVTEPAGTHEICDTLSYELVLTSSEPANMYDVKLWTNLPEGAQIIQAAYQYPEANAAWTTLAQTSSQFSGYNPAGWDLSALVPQFENGFPGSRQPNENELRVRFDVVMDCNYNPNQELLIFAQGMSNCSDSLLLNAHYFLPIAGFENLVNYDLLHQVKDTLNCESPNTITYVVSNLDNRPNTLGDSLRVELPLGYHFVTGSAVPNQPVLEGNILSWAVGTVDANTTKTFSFRIEADSIFECHELMFAAELFRTRASSCAAACEITASWKDTLHTVYCCTACPANASFRADTICVGSEICFVPVSAMLAAEFTHSWDFGDGSFSGQAEPCHTFASAGNHAVKHVVRSANGCSDTLVQQVFVRGLDSGNAAFSMEDTVCVLDTACFAAADMNAFQRWNLYNSNGSPFVSFGNYPEFCFQFPNPGTYSIEHMTDDGCGRDTVTKTITVVAPIEACIVLIGQNPFCYGSQVLLTINDPFNQVQQVDWYRNGVYVGTMDTLVATQGGTYAALVVDYNGCTNSCMCMVLTQTPAPAVKLAKHVYVCGDGNAQQLRAETQASCLWMTDNSVIASGNNLNVSVPGTYVVQATASNGCVTMDSIVVEERRIEPQLTASVASACVGENIELSAVCDPYYHYQWQKLVAGTWININGTDCNLTTAVYKAGPNSFRVIIRDQVSGCETTKNIQVQGTTARCNPITVSPNPTEKQQTSVHYSFDGTDLKSAQLEVYSMRGELVMDRELDLRMTKADLDFTGFSEGIYLVRIIVDGQLLTTEKIMVLNH